MRQRLITLASLACLTSACGQVRAQSTVARVSPPPPPTLTTLAAGLPVRAAVQPAAPATPKPASVHAASWRVAEVPGRAFASSGLARLAVDGLGLTEWNPRVFVAPSAPQWLALPLQSPAQDELMVVWHGHAMHYVNYDYGRPRTYDIETSIDSSNGGDGTWKSALHVDDNMVRSRATTFKAPGARWVRLVFTTAWSGVAREPFLREVTVRERTSAGAPDVWLVLGDSTTSVGLDPASPAYFSAHVTAKWPTHHPILLSGGTGGDTSADAPARLAAALPTLPANSVIGLCYGSNDAKWGVAMETYRARLQTAVDLVKRAGHQPMLAVLPWSLNGNIAAYAQVCKEVATANQLPAGPDFHAYFKAHEQEMEPDRVHPNAEGVKAMQRLWAERAGFRYD